MKDHANIKDFLKSDAFLQSTINNKTVESIVLLFGGEDNFVSKFSPELLSAEMKVPPELEDSWDVQTVYSQNRDDIYQLVVNKTTLSDNQDFLHAVKAHCATATLDEVARGLSDPAVNNASNPALLEAGRYMVKEVCAILTELFGAYYARARAIHYFSTLLEKPLPIAVFVTGYATGYESTMSSELAQALVGLAGGYKETYCRAEQAVNNLNNYNNDKALSESETEVFYENNRELIIGFLTDLAKNDFKVGLLQYINHEYYNMSGDADTISRVLYSECNKTIQHGVDRDSTKRLFIVEDCLTKLFESIYLNLMKHD